MFFGRKTQVNDRTLPSEGMTGGEIEVLGYPRYERIESPSNGFHVKGENLLGGEEGKGF